MKIEIQNFSLTYNNSVIFKNFNLKIQEGETVGIYGPTGSGKSTLLSHIARLYSDKIKTAYCFQENLLLMNESVYKNLQIICKNRVNIALIDQCLEGFDLLNKKNQKCKLLSGGELQRTAIARCFLWNGDLFLLDEPFSSQDLLHSEQIKMQIKKLQREGKTILIVSHNKKDLSELNCRIVEL